MKIILTDIEREQIRKETLEEVEKIIDEVKYPNESMYDCSNQSSQDFILVLEFKRKLQKLKEIADGKTNNFM
jgi:hypothetical protein